MLLGFCRQLPVSLVAMWELMPVPASSLGLAYMAKVLDGRDAVFPVGLRTGFGVGYWISEHHPSCLILVFHLVLLFGHLLDLADCRQQAGHCFYGDPNLSIVKGNACGVPVAALCSPGLSSQW